MYKVGITWGFICRLYFDDDVKTVLFNLSATPSVALRPDINLDFLHRLTYLKLLFETLFELSKKTKKQTKQFHNSRLTFNATQKSEVSSSYFSFDFRDGVF